MPMFRNINLLAHEEGTECYEMLAFKLQTLVKYPEDIIQTIYRSGSSVNPHHTGFQRLFSN
jgi:hypothetical protein